MFTSRADFRLSLRADNADQRLTPLATNLGCVSETRRVAYEDKWDRLQKSRSELESSIFTPKQISQAGIYVNQDGNKRSAFDVLAFPDVNFEDIIPLLHGCETADGETRRQLERDALYVHYIARQEKEIAAVKRDEGHLIPTDFDYSSIDGLSAELKQKLTKARPETLAKASRIGGMTPAGLALILARLRRDKRIQEKTA
jgi:tRNA uridine 5-carboxymethylaminomethyl modification enzyme